MSVGGTIYGVILNDAVEHASLAADFGRKPYESPPQAPVVYMKPQICVTRGDVPLPDDADTVEAAPTLGLLFRRDATSVHPGQAMAHVGGVCLALDVSAPQTDYYRPAVSQRCRDGFLPLGPFAWSELPNSIGTSIDGAQAHDWSLDRLVRPLPVLIADLSSFMTLRAGDLLLIGLPGDAPRVTRGQRVRVAAEGLPALDAAFVGGAK